MPALAPDRLLRSHAALRPRASLLDRALALAETEAVPSALVDVQLVRRRRPPPAPCRADSCAAPARRLSSAVCQMKKGGASG